MENQENPENIQIVDIEKKLEENKKAKKKFFKKLSIGLIIFILLLLAISAFLVIKDKLNQNKYIVSTPPETTKTIEPPVIEKEIEYSSDILKINLTYPREAALIENMGGEVKKTDIIYSLNEADLTIIDETSLEEGYIFRVVKFKSSNRDLKEIADVKRRSFFENCPESAGISNLDETNINDFEAFEFEITNCGGDYKITYTQNFDHIYEFSQIYAGDLGYRQRYGAITQEIFNSFSFYPPEEEPMGETKTYLNDKLGFSFKHPYLDEECCTIQSPIKELEPLITLGYQNNILGIFSTRYSGKSDYRTYIEEQKQTLIDDYKAVKGIDPAPKETLINIGNKVGNLLEGYSWQEYDYVYIDIDDLRSNAVLIFTIKNTGDEDFKNILNDLYDSFEFF